jgi:hypothetical protein
MVASLVGSVTWRKVDDAARDVGVLVGAVLGVSGEALVCD